MMNKTTKARLSSSTEDQLSTPQRYHSLAITLHWLIALGIVFMFASGTYMLYGDLSKAEQYKLFQIHKSAGVLILLSVVARVATRISTHPPALPSGLSGRDKRLSKLGHLGLYACLIVMPISGWVMVSASPFGLPTIVFGWFEWPHIPGISRNKPIETLARTIHWTTASVFLSLIILHLGAVIKHQYFEKINLIKRMWW